MDAILFKDLFLSNGQFHNIIIHDITLSDICCQFPGFYKTQAFVSGNRIGVMFIDGQPDMVPSIFLAQ